MLFSRDALVRLIVPLVIEQLLAICIGMADTIMVTSVSESAVSAVSLVDSINILLIQLFPPWLPAVLWSPPNIWAVEIKTTPAKPPSSSCILPS